MRLRSWAPGEGLKGAAPEKQKRADFGRKPREPKHLDAIRQCPCLICGNPAEPAHIRMSDGPAKPNSGIGQKPPDRYTVPLCPDHHRQGGDAQHSRGERIWWEEKGINPFIVADKLHRLSPDVEAMRAIINKRRAGL